MEPGDTCLQSYSPSIEEAMVGHLLKIPDQPGLQNMQNKTKRMKDITFRISKGKKII